MLQTISRAALTEMAPPRAGETKLSQSVELLSSLEDLSQCRAPYVLLGICEDIGIRANLGVPGAARTWHHFLPALGSIQDNQFLKGQQLAILGSLEFPDAMKEAASLDSSQSRDLEKLRQLTAQIDQEVQPVINQIVKAGKIPIVIGGGHNNALGNIAGTATALQRPIAVLNIDPHTDFRQCEGRHSGNGFRYAHRDGHLQRYGVFGLHQSYNNSENLEQFDHLSELHYISMEELLACTREEFDRHFKNLLHFLGHDGIGLEIDTDCLQKFPVSALNPSGFDLNQLRFLLRTAASISTIHYLHLCEASVGRSSSPEETQMLAKSLAYLVTDFVKTHSK